MDREFLQKRRTELGLSQSKIAEALGYSTQTVSLWENGKGAPGLPVWGKLAALLEIDLEGLLSDKVQKENALCEEKEFDPDSFAETLKTMRKRLGLTQAELAKRIGVPSNAIIRFEHGSSFPSEEQFRKLASVYGLSLEDLYYGQLPAPLPRKESEKNRKPWPAKRTFFIVLFALFVVAGGVYLYAGLSPKSAPGRSEEDVSSSLPSASGPTSFSSQDIPYSESANSVSSKMPLSSSEESLSYSEEPSSEPMGSSTEDPSTPTSSEPSSEPEEASSKDSSAPASSEEPSSSESPPSQEQSSSSSSVSPKTYAVDFDLDGGTSPSYEGVVSITSLDEAFFFDVSKENFTFRGWLYENVWIIDEKGIYQKSVALQDGMLFKAKYEAIAYPITYVLDGGTNDEGNPSSITFAETIVLEDAAKPGYLFEGWYRDGDYLTSIDTLVGSEIKELGGITLYAKFAYNSLDPYNYPYLTFTKLPGNKASVKYSGASTLEEKLILPEKITLEGKDCFLTLIEEGAFSGLSSFQAIDLPAHLESIGAGAFKGCASLNSVKLLSEESLFIGSEAFASCPSLRFVKIGGCVSSIGGDAFKSCHEDLVFLFEYGYDDSLGRAWNPDHRPIVPFGMAFGYTIELGVKYMKMSVSGFEAYCVFGTTSLSADIQATNYGTPVMMIAENAFYQADLESCSLPSSMRIVSAYAFAYSSLPSIYIPESVDEILDYAFLGAENLAISCQAPSKPEGWSYLWNPSGRPVTWNQ